MIRNDNFILIQGSMVNELNLKGNELLIYAIINGFCQEENQRYTGSLQYLVKWTNSTKQGVIKNLKSLIEKGLIEKEEKFINGVKFCEYYTTKFTRVLNKVDQGIKQSLPGGIKQSLPNNIDIYNIDNNIDINKKKKKETEFDLIINSYTDNEELKNTIYEFLRMRKAIKKPMTTKALSLLLNKLDKLAQNNDTARIQILEQSIINSWQSIYELKEGFNGSTGKNTPASEDRWSKYTFE